VNPTLGWKRRGSKLGGEAFVTAGKVGVEGWQMKRVKAWRRGRKKSTLPGGVADRSLQIVSLVDP